MIISTCAPLCLLEVTFDTATDTCSRHRRYSKVLGSHLTELVSQISLGALVNAFYALESAPGQEVGWTRITHNWLTSSAAAKHDNHHSRCNGHCLTRDLCKLAQPILPCRSCSELATEDVWSVSASVIRRRFAVSCLLGSHPTRPYWLLLELMLDILIIEHLRSHCRRCAHLGWRRSTDVSAAPSASVAVPGIGFYCSCISKPALTFFFSRVWCLW